MKHMVKGLALSATAVIGFAFTSLGATTIYVGGDHEGAVATLAAANSALAALTDADYPVEIVIAKGNYSGAAFTLNKPITVRGATGNAADVIITSPVRSFNLSVADAAVRDLTISGTGATGSGAHINMTAGMVTNCVVSGGTFGSNGQGANVWMSGGLLVDSTLKNGGVASSSNPPSYPNYGGNLYISGGRAVRCQMTGGRLCVNKNSTPRGAGIYAAGTASVESCLVADNTIASAGGDGAGIYVTGSAKIVNCTVIGNTGATSANGISVASATARVVNTVVFDNGGAEAKELGTVNLDRYVNCAAADGVAGEGWKVVSSSDFFDALNGFYTLRPGSALIDAGSIDQEVVPESVLADGSVDLYGDTRLSGDSLDIGCGEFDHSRPFAELVGRGGFAGFDTPFRAQIAHDPQDTVVYRWDFGDGGEAEDFSTEDCTHVYGNIGIYYVRVAAVVNDEQGPWKELHLPVVVVPEKIYVNKLSATPVPPYDSKDTAARTFGEAFNVMTNVHTAGQPYFGTIVIPQGATVDGGQNLKLNYAVTIRGETDNPADATISNAGKSGRAFTLNSAESVLANLTISGARTTSESITGSQIGLTDGVVTNCVIADGSLGSYGKGGNVSMSGGLIIDSVIRGGGAAGASDPSKNPRGIDGANVYMTGGRIARCKVTGGRAYTRTGYTSHGGGVYASGDSCIENCVFLNNAITVSGDGAGIYALDTAVVANCLVCGCSGATGANGISVQSPDVTVVNTVILDNGGTASQEFGTANLDRYFNCAAADGVAGEGWQVVSKDDFEDFQNGAFTPKSGTALVDNGTSDPELVPATVLAADALDFHGNPRKSGSAIDIGCGELDQSSATGELVGRGGVVGAQTTFRASIAHEPGDVVKYLWKFGDSDEVVESDDEVCTHVYEDAGLYAVSVAAVVNGQQGKWKDLTFPALVVPEKIYVNKLSATPVPPYDTKDTAARTFREAFNVMTNVHTAGQPYFGTIVIPQGATVDGGQNLQLNYAVTIRGETDNPADATINDVTKGSRAFTLNSAESVLANLTISGVQTLGTADMQGCHLKMTDGVVTNCIIASGAYGSGGQGGNIWMSGGLVVDSTLKDGGVPSGNNPSNPQSGGNLYITGGRAVRCRISGGRIYAAASKTSSGGSVYAAGQASVESCVVSGGWIDRVSGGYGSGAGIYVAGQAHVANCLVYGCSGASGANGIEVASADAAVVNTVILDNGGTAPQEFGTVNLERYFNCAAADGVAPEGWQVVSTDDFEDFQNGAFTPKSGTALVDNGTSDPELVPATVLAADALDFHGNPRKSGSAIDIGCGELDQSSVSGEQVGRGGVVGAQTTFRASIAHEPTDVVKYLWKFGDSDETVESVDEVCTHTYQYAGLYQVSVAAVVNGQQGKWKELSNPVLIVPAKVWVDNRCETSEWPYATKETAATNLKDALNVLTNTYSANLPVFGTVVIAQGANLPSTANNTGLTLNYAVTVRGETDDPADAVINDSLASPKRAFTLNDDGAVLANLTIRGTVANAADRNNVEGSHIHMTKGVVTNCVIAGGVLGTSGHGGNVWMSGGLLVDSTLQNGGAIQNSSNMEGGNIFMTAGLVMRCKVMNGSMSGGGSGAGSGAGIYALGGCVENCLIADSTVLSGGTGADAVGIYAGEDAKIVNCTVCNGSGANSVNGVMVAGSRVKVVNTVIYGNGETLAKNVGTANTNNLDCCATEFEGLNETCKKIDETAFKSYAEWQATGDIQFLAPANGKPLNNGGCKVKDYPATGAISATDLRGRNRLSGKRVDIGALETPNACSYILIR